MKIEWNKVTWYSKLLAAIFFIFIVPIITFKIGSAYQDTKSIIKTYNTTEVSQNAVQENNTSEVMNSGIFAQVKSPEYECETNNICEERPYTGHIVIKGMDGQTVTTTQVRNDGTFFALLSPGSYRVFPLSPKPIPSIKPVTVVIEKDTIIKKTVRFEIES